MAGYFQLRRRLTIKKNAKLNSSDKDLAFSKNPLKGPLIDTNETIAKEAIEANKWIMIYMGDRKMPAIAQKDGLSPIDVAHLVLCLAVDNPQLRDEVYCQVIKQITNNPNEVSEEKGWELMCMLLETVQPSKAIEGDLMAHFQNPTQTNERIIKFTNYCLQRLNAITKRPLVPKRPQMAALDDIRNAPFIQSVFRSSLEDLMEMQKNTHPDLNVPVVLKTLAEAIISSKGIVSEGIFRLAGNRDKMAVMKKELEDSKGFMCSPQTDPHVPANLLKIWLSEIRKPVIPPEYYDNIIDYSKKWSKLNDIIQSFPEVHKNTLYYLVNFLQRVAKTRENMMDHHNLSVVFSPALCRCPATSTTMAMTLTNAESTFVCTLLKNLPQKNV